MSLRNLNQENIKYNYLAINLDVHRDSYVEKRMSLNGSAHHAGIFCCETRVQAVNLCSSISNISSK